MLHRLAIALVCTALWAGLLYVGIAFELVFWLFILAGYAVISAMCPDIDDLFWPDRKNH